MNTLECMIIVKGEIKTKQISYCEYNELTHKYDIRFNHGQIYSYTCDNVEYIRKPKILNPDMYCIFHGNEQIKGISSILLYSSTPMHKSTSGILSIISFLYLLARQPVTIKALHLFSL